ncbi:MAG: type IV pilin protein [Pseudomonadota bacterium]
MRHSRGFVLIEALVTVLILSVLAAAAYPSFHRYVVRSKRVEAQAALLMLMQQQERYFTQNNSYIAFSSASTDEQERQFKWWSGVSAASSAYEVEGKACPGERIADCVQLVATPGTEQVDHLFRDEECEQLTLTSTGLRQASGPGTRCWR